MTEFSAALLFEADRDLAKMLSSANDIMSAFGIAEGTNIIDHGTDFVLGDEAFQPLEMLGRANDRSRYSRRSRRGFDRRQTMTEKLELTRPPMFHVVTDDPTAAPTSAACDKGMRPSRVPWTSPIFSMSRQLRLTARLLIKIWMGTSSGTGVAADLGVINEPSRARAWWRESIAFPIWSERGLQIEYQSIAATRRGVGRNRAADQSLVGIDLC